MKASGAAYVFTLAVVGGLALPETAAAQTPVSRACPSPTNQMLIGIKGKQGSWMDSIKGVCAFLSDILDVNTTLSKQYTTTAGTSTGGTERETLCPRGMVLIGLTGTKDKAAFVTPDVVTTVHAIHCQRLDATTRRAVGSRFDVNAFPKLGDAGSYMMGPGFCIDGKVGKRLQTVSATYVHNVANVCDWAPGADQTIAGGGNTTVPTSGGTTTGGTTTSTAAPDLVPVFQGPVLRHIAQIRKIASEPFCQGMFAQPTIAVVKTITAPGITIGVKNAGNAAVPTTTTFIVQVLYGSTSVPVPIVGGIKAGETKTFTITPRPQAMTEVARMPLVPSATQKQIYNALGGECVQTIGQETAYNWQDPVIEIRVDPGNAVPSDPKGNNNKQY